MKQPRKKVPTISAEEFRWRASFLLPGCWSIFAAMDFKQVKELAALLVGKFPPASVTLVDLGGTAGVVVQRICETSASTVVIQESEPFLDKEIERLDFLRSRLQIGKTLIWTLSLSTAERLMEQAPNIASLIDGSVFQWDPLAHDLTEDERDQRIRALRKWSKLSDRQVLARARKGQLPPDPEYAEWITLLGHGGLLVRRK